MKSEKNEYIGDDKFNALLEHYSCPLALCAIKARFAGAACSPNVGITPAEIIASLWQKGREPRLETKAEADLFFKFFMGLWDDVFNQVLNGKFRLAKVETGEKEELIEACLRRQGELESGFVEGFWAGKKELNIPAFIAELVESLTDLGNVYHTLALKADRGADLEEIRLAITNSDKMAEKAIAFIAENQFAGKG